MLLTKGRLASAEMARAAEAAAAGCNPHAPRRQVDEGALGWDMLRAADSAKRWQTAPARATADHDGVAVSALAFPGVLSEAALEAWLDVSIGMIGMHLLRLKAILNMDGNERPLCCTACDTWCTRQSSCRVGRNGRFATACC